MDERPLTVLRDQHLHGRNTGFSCTTAPTFDQEGRLAAALDVSSARSELTEGFVELIAVVLGDIARRIEAENFRLRFPQARIVIAPARTICRTR